MKSLVMVVAAVASMVVPSATSSAAPHGCLRDTTVPLGQTVPVHINSGGLDRTYFLHLPADYPESGPMPVVLAFHGHNGTGTDIETFSGIDALDTIAVYPVGLPGTDGETAWQGAPYASPANDVLFVSDVLDQLEGTLCVDVNRIYATGKSNGGGFTALLACQLPNRIAAFATVAGAFYPGTTQGCESSPPVPIVDFHGTGDTTIPYDGGTSHGADLPPLMQWAQGWADHNDCTSPSSNTIGTDVTEFQWDDCAQYASVTHYRIDGAGHTWPGASVASGSGSTTQTISATAIMWQFFAAHSLVGAGQ